MLESSSVCIGLKCVWNGRSKQEKLNSNCDKSIFEEQSILLSGPYGDDVAFIRQFNHQIIIGLSDGVSGNRHHGLDPYEFAHELINSCLEQTDIVHGSSSMRGLVHRAIRSVEKRSIFGSATLCLLSIDKCSSCLRSLNIGDSGFMLIRNKQLLLRSVPQYHRGSSPFQLSSFPRTHLFSSTNLTRLYQDKPSDGQYLEQHLQIGDVLLIASDGLFDNLYEDFIVQILNNHLDANHSIESLQNVCEFLVESACHAHIKRDDILVLLFVVVPCSRVSMTAEQINVKRKTTSSSSSSDCSLNEKDEQSLDLFIFED